MQWRKGAKVQRHKGAKAQRYKGVKAQRCNTAHYNSTVLHCSTVLLDGAAWHFTIAWHSAEQ